MAKHMTIRNYLRPKANSNNQQLINHLQKSDSYQRLHIHVTFLGTIGRVVRKPGFLVCAGFTVKEDFSLWLLLIVLTVNDIN